MDSLGATTTTEAGNRMAPMTMAPTASNKKIWIIVGLIIAGYLFWKSKKK